MRFPHSTSPMTFLPTSPMTFLPTSPMTFLLAIAAAVLSGAACGSTGNPDRPDASHLLPDGMVFDSRTPDAAPDAQARHRCADGQDNDGDGLVDYPEDPGCTSAEDEDESNPPFCGLDAQGQMIPLRVLPSTLHLVQTTEHGSSHYAGSCGGEDAPELIFQLEVGAGTSGLVISTMSEDDPPITQLDTVLYVRRDTCDASSTELACAAADPGAGGTEITLVDPAPGTYFIFVDGGAPGAEGQFLLQVHGLLPLGNPCNPADQALVCAPGIVCASPQPGDPTVCMVPYCNDGLDNDGDGIVDFPQEPGCESALDNSEEDTCPAGAGCPECADGVDNDGDSLVDWPDDPGCRSAGDPQELDACVSGLTFTLLPPSGNDTQIFANSAQSRTSGSCSLTSGPEIVYPLHLEHGADSLEVTASTLMYTSLALYLRQTDCSDGTELACSMTYQNPEHLSAQELPPGDYFLFVDTEDFYSSDTVDVSVTVLLPVGAPCVPGAALASCSPGGLCQDVGGGATQCVPTLCNNGVDDDGDGLVDFPNDPGCTDRADLDEADSCATTPSACPACWDGVDNDGDNRVDFPADPGCGSAADGNEADQCVAGLPFQDITATGQDTGSAPGYTSLLQGNCGGTGYGESVYLLRLPSPAASVSIQTTTAVDSWGDPDIQTTLYARHGQCDALTAELGCHVAPISGSGQNALQLLGVDQGNLFVVVDAEDVWNSAGTYDLTVTATLTAGGTCIPSAQALQCPTGTTCSDPGTGPICQ